MLPLFLDGRPPFITNYILYHFKKVFLFLSILDSFLSEPTTAGDELILKMKVEMEMVCMKHEPYLLVSDLNTYWNFMKEK